MSHHHGVWTINVKHQFSSTVCHIVSLHFPTSHLPLWYDTWNLVKNFQSTSPSPPTNNTTWSQRERKTQRREKALSLSLSLWAMEAKKQKKKDQNHHQYRSKYFVSLSKPLLLFHSFVLFMLYYISSQKNSPQTLLSLMSLKPNYDLWIPHCQKASSNGFCMYHRHEN